MEPRMGTIFHDFTEKYTDFGVSENNDKTGYTKHMQILVKTDWFDAAGLEVVHIIVKHMYFYEFAKFSSSLRSRMSVHVQIHWKTLCF